MKKFVLALLMMFCGIMIASNLLAQPIVKTHVETGDNNPLVRDSPKI